MISVNFHRLPVACHQRSLIFIDFRLICINFDYFFSFFKKEYQRMKASGHLRPFARVPELPIVCRHETALARPPSLCVSTEKITFLAVNGQTVCTFPAPCLSQRLSDRDPHAAGLAGPAGLLPPLRDRPLVAASGRFDRGDLRPPRAGPRAAALARAHRVGPGRFR